MTQSLRQIKSRIHSIENTEKLTRAMEMVSVSKLKSAQRALVHSREYSSKVDGILRNLLFSFKKEGHPLLEERENKKSLALCVITSDTGLCGSYNHSIIRAAQDFLGKTGGREIKLITVGKKALSYFKRMGLEVHSAYAEIYGRYSRESCDKITRNLTDMFLKRQADEVHVAYMNFESPSRYAPALERLLNVKLADGQELDYIVEPDAHSLLGELLPLHVLNRMRGIVLSAFAAEHAARAIAMGEATDNADELLDELVLLRNKVRQTNITREIIEVISTVEAMKG